MTRAALALKPQEMPLRFLLGAPTVQWEVTGTRACSQVPKGKRAATKKGQGLPFRSEVPHPVELTCSAAWLGSEQQRPQGLGQD